MIIIVVGNVGEGKTVSMVQTILARQRQFKDSKKPYVALTNFNLKKNVKKWKRIKLDHIIKEVETRTFTPTGRESKKKGHAVNWHWWEKTQEKYCYDIFIDELNSTVLNRDAASTQNKLISRWLFQIRKILGAGEKHNLYCITQDLDMVDINFRRLAHWIVDCTKIKGRDPVVIMHTFYAGQNAYYTGRYSHRKAFVANPFFKYYDSYELVKFSDSEVYL